MFRCAYLAARDTHASPHARGDVPAALDAQEELEAESPEAAQARAEAEAERAQERFQDGFFETLSSADYASRQEAVDSMYEDEFVSELESGEEGPRVRSRGATEAEAAELESGKKIRVYRDGAAD